MFDPKFLDDLAKRLSDSVPSGVQHFQTDIQKNFKSVLGSALNQLDLVTREEFDIQTAVLERTREKLERLEQQLEVLEKKINQ